MDKTLSNEVERLIGLYRDSLEYKETLRSGAESLNKVAFVARGRSDEIHGQARTLIEGLQAEFNMMVEVCNQHEARFRAAEADFLKTFDNSALMLVYNGASSIVEDLRNSDVSPFEYAVREVNEVIKDLVWDECYRRDKELSKRRGNP